MTTAHAVEVSSEPERVGMSAERLARIDAALGRYVDRGVLAGASTIVARRGEVVHAGLIGERDREAGLPMTADTIFRLYSMTKPVVSTALMMLHEEGLFQLEYPVSRYLPAFGGVKVLAADGSLVDPVRPIEVRDLLTHTSGLTYDFMVDNGAAEHYRQHRIMNDAGRSLAEVIDAVAELPLAFQPGEVWHYSVGIDVAARLVEVLADQPLQTFLAERLFEPLGMTDTGFGVPDAALGRLAAMYGLPDLIGRDYTVNELVEAALGGYHERLDVSDTYPTDTPDIFVRGGLGLFGTVGDYWRFAQMLLDNGRAGDRHLIGRKTLELMHSNHLPEALLPFDLLGRDNRGVGFGLGSRVMMNVAATGGPGSPGEYGWAGAAKTYFLVDPVEELVAVFMTQYMTGVELPDRDFRSLVYQAIVD